MSDANITVSIDRLIFDGLSISRNQYPQIQAAVEAELARLLASTRLFQGLAQGGSLPSAPGGHIQLTSYADPADLGQQIARAVYSGIGGETR